MEQLSVVLLAKEVKTGIHNISLALSLSLKDDSFYRGKEAWKQII